VSDSDSAQMITLAIDIGSTRTRVAAVDIDGLRCFNRYDSDNNDFDTAFGANIKKITDAYRQIRRVNITSCVKNLAAKAKDICINNNERRFDTVELIHPHDGLPVAFKYENPNTLGTDRICNSLACAALFKDKNCIIIDVGTAITVDYLRDRKIFEGGAILPGYDMQFRALHTGTDALPLINTNNLNGINRINGINPTISLPSTSTANCIKAGVLYGTAGAVDRCIDECLCVNGNDSDGNNVLIIATGGGWESIRPLIKHKVTTIPDLTLIGAGIYR